MSFIKTERNLNNFTRDPEEIMELIQKYQGGIDNRQKLPEMDYEEACREYKFYKARTHKCDQDDPDFEQNVKFREFFLSIKKRYDMQDRAKRFRLRQKAEIAYLRDIADKKSEDVAASSVSFGGVLGQKRENPVDVKMLEMEARMRRLEYQLVAKNKQILELERKPFLVNTKVEKAEALSPSKQMSSVSTITEEDNEVVAKPQKAVEVREEFEKCSTSEQSLNMKRRKLIVTINTSIEPEPSCQEEESVMRQGTIETTESQKDYLNFNETVEPSCQNASDAISERAQNLVQSERIQRLIRKFIDKKLQYTNIQSKKVIQQIQEKEAVIRSGREQLSNKIKDTLEQKISYAKLRKQSDQLLSRREQYLYSMERLENQIRLIDENYASTVEFLEEQQVKLQESEEWIGAMSDEINRNVSELQVMKSNHRNGIFNQ